MRSLMVVTLVILTTLIVHNVALSGGALNPPPELSSIAYAVYDADYGYLILEKNATQRRSIASINKVMTLLVAIELVETGKINLNDQVTASARAASRGGTQINLKAGDQFSLEELLYATALQSANDAAVALAEYIAGSEAEFTKLMNSKAKELGLNDTNYVDCTGLLSIFSNNYSTAFDQVRLLQVALQHQLFREIFGAPDYFLASQDRKIRNSHPLLDTHGVEGGKTGATTPAGHTLITSCVRHERRLIVVVLGARSREVRNSENEELLEWAFFNLRTVISTEKVLESVSVPDGVDHLIDAVLGQEFSVVAIQESDLQYTTRTEVDEDLHAPIDRGDKIGELVVLKGDQEFVRLDLVAHQGTGLATWLRRIFNNILRFFGKSG